MTPFNRLVKRLADGKKPLLQDVELLVAYHTQAIISVKMHPASDQYYIARYYFEKLAVELHGTPPFDYSALVIQPEEEVVRLEKLMKKYRNTIKKRKFILTFFHWHKAGHKEIEDFTEMNKFFTWYRRRLNAKRKRNQ